MERLSVLKAELQRHLGADGEAAGKDKSLSDDVAEAAVGALKDLKDCHVTTDLLLKTQVHNPAAPMCEPVDAETHAQNPGCSHTWRSGSRNACA